MRAHFSIRGLVALILLAGFALGSLRASTIGWAAAWILLAILALCTATLVAVVLPASRQAPWLGFALFGWAYFLLHFSPAVEWRDGFGPAHFTTLAIDALVSPLIAPDLEYGISAGRTERFFISHSGQSNNYFCAVCHSLISLVFGAIGATVGRFAELSRRSDHPRSPSEDGPVTQA